MPKIFEFDDAWYRNASRNAEGEPQPLDVGYCVFKPEQVRFLTAKERHAANEPFEAALANERLAGPFPTEEEAHGGGRKDAYSRAGDAAFAKALAEGKPRDEAGSIAMRAAAAARAAEEAKKAPPAPEVAPAAPEPVAPAPEPETNVEEPAPPAPTPEAKVEEPAPVPAPASSDMFDDDEPATDPGSKPAPASSSSKPASSSSSSKKKGK